MTLAGQLAQPTATFPVPSAFPTPVPVPTFGLTDSDARLIGANPGVFTSSNFLVPPTQNVTNTAALAAAVGLDTDPTAWTPEQAAAQTDRALARIGAVNPELAQDLAVRRQGDAAVADEDGGFLADAWNAVTGAVGDVVGGALDLLDRASHIVPEVLYDNDESVWKNVGDALSGNSDTRWRDVLEDKWGWDRSWMTQALGFVGDVATDPLTYLTFGAGGVARTTTSRALATTTVKAFLEGQGTSLVDDMVRRGIASNADEAAALVMRTGEAGDILAAEAQRSLGGQLRQLAGKAHPDAQGGLTFSMFQQTEEELLKQAVQVGSDAYRLGSTAGFARVTPEAFRAVTGVERGVVEDALRATVRAGSGFGVERAAYEAGKAAGGVLGGVRFRLPVPMLGFRFQTGGSALLRATQKADFQVARRFFAGLSGNVRLTRMVGQGKASVDELRAFWEDGFSGVKSMSQALQSDTYQTLSRGALHLGSVAYPLSEAVGDFTRHFSPSAALLRGGGLAVKAASNMRRIAGHIEAQVDESIRTLVRPDGSLASFKDTDEFLVKTWTAIPETDRGTYFGELDEFTVTRAIGQEPTQTAEQFYSPRIRDAEVNGQVALAADLRESMTRAKAAEQALSAHGEEHLEAARQFHAINVNRRGEYMNIGWGNDVTDQNLAQAAELRQADADRLIAGNHELVRRTDLAAVNPLDYLNGVNRSVLLDADPAGVNTVRGAHFFVPSAEATAQAAKVAEQADELVPVGAARDVQAEQAARGGLDEAEEAAAQDDFATRLLAAAGVEVERPAGVAVLEQGQYAVELRNPLVRNRTGAGAGATDVIDPVADLERQFDDVLKEAKTRLGQEVDEADLSAVTDARIRKLIEDDLDGVAQKGEYVRRKLVQMGHDGVITQTDEGTHIAVLARDDGTVPAARINNKAAHVGVSTLPAPRVATEAVQAAVHKMPAVRELPGGSDAWLRETLRDTARMSVPEAEEHITRQLREIGVSLLPGQRVLETDPYTVMRGISKNTARDVRDAFLNRTARRIDNLGMATSVWRGGMSGTAPFRFTVNEGRFEQARRYLGRLYKAEERLAHFQATGGKEVLDARSRALTQQIARTTQDVESQLTMLKNEARRDAEDALWTEEDIIAGLGNWDAAFRRAEAEGIHAVRDAATNGWFKLSDNIYHFRSANKDAYLWVENGRVLSVREIKEPGPLARQLLDAARQPFTRPVTAWTAPSARGKRDDLGMSLADALLDQDWADRGIDSLEKAAEAIESQTFSKAGAKLNVRKLDRMKSDFVAKATRELEDQRRKTQQLLADGRQAVDEVNKLTAKLTTAQSPMARAMELVPEALENVRNQTGMTNVTLRGLGTWQMPDFVAQEFAQAAAPFRQLTGFHKQFRQFNSWWKTMATWMFPGFHMRNIMGAYFNSWLGGVGMKEYYQTGRVLRAAWEVSNKPPGEWRWASRPLKAKDPDLVAAFRRGGYKNIGGVPLDEATYGDLYAMQVDMGLLAGNGRAFAEAELGIEAAERQAVGSRPIERLPRWAGGGVARTYVAGMRGAGTLTENTFRTATFLRGIKDYGDLFEARASVMMRHGDYADLTDMEYTWVRDVVPFYKWMRTNIPYQFHQLFENPGKLLGVVKAQDALLSDEQKYATPDWMKTQFIVPTGGEEGGAFNAVMLDLPMSDLHVNARELLSSTLPMLRPFLESYVFEQSTFSGAPIEGKPTRLPAVFEPLAPVLEAVGLVNTGPDGAPFTDDKTLNVLSIIPPFSRARNWLFEDPDRVKLRTNTWASGVFGIGIRPVDREQLTDTELQFYYSQVLPQLEHLKDMGYTLPSTDDIQAIGQTTDTVLANLGITPATALVAQ